MQLASTLIDSILSGEIKSGNKLPSVRQLVAQTGYAKNTVIRALNELESSGYIESKPRQGFFVSLANTKHNPPAASDTVLAPNEVNLPELFHRTMLNGAAFDIAPKSTDKETTGQIPELIKCITRVQKQSVANNALYYDIPDGDLSLKEQIIERYKERSLPMNDNYLCITSGCQNALFLALSVCCKPGDTVVVESPGFYGVLQLLEQLQLNIIEAPSSSESGLNLDILSELLLQYKISACVVTPNFATPTGALMCEKNKKSLIALANLHQFTLVEDDIYGELGFQGKTTPLSNYDTQGRVILCGSFSKSLSRDLRIGWLYSKRWAAKVTRMKLATQLAGSKAIQKGVAEFIKTGYYRRHLQSLNIQLIKNRNQLISTLLQYWPSDIKYSFPQGGLCLWVELNQHVDGDRLYSAMAKKGIIVTPGSLFSYSPTYKHCIRLSYSHPVIGERLKSLRVLGSTIKRLSSKEQPQYKQE